MQEGRSLKLKKIKNPIYMRNMNGIFNKEGLIEYTVKVNIYYQRYRERTEIDIIDSTLWTTML